jgi:hypothetical protein
MLYNESNFFKQCKTGYCITYSANNDRVQKISTVEPVSQIGIAEAFSSPSNAFNSVIGVYDELQGDNGYGIRINLYYPFDSDEGIVSGGLDNAVAVLAGTSYSYQILNYAILLYSCTGCMKGQICV